MPETVNGVYSLQLSDGSNITPIITTPIATFRFGPVSVNAPRGTAIYAGSALTPPNSSSTYLYQLPLAGSGQQSQIQTAGEIDTCWTAREASVIVFTTNILDQPIYTMQSDGSGVQSTGVMGLPMGISPDGSKILFTLPKNIHDGNSGDLFIMDATGAHASLLRSATTYIVSASFNPSTPNQIVFCMIDVEQGGRSGIYTINANGTDLSLVYPHGPDSHWASFSPDGSWIVFSSFADNWQLFKVTKDGGNLTRLTFYMDKRYNKPDFSLDGTLIIVSSHY